jgi:hypothetical protein
MKCPARFYSPPPERGRTVAEGDQVGVLLTRRKKGPPPGRCAADLPLSGGGKEFEERAR